MAQSLWKAYWPLMLVLLGTVASSTSCMAPKSRTAQRPPVMNRLCSGVTPLSLAHMNWPAFRQRLEDLENPSLEKALCLIPEMLMKQNSVLMISAHSLQPASVTAPRVLIYPDETPRPQSEQLFFSMNDAASSNGNTLQILRQAPGAKMPELIEIDFKNGLDIRTGNPGRCQKCHGLEPRFLWSERDFWPAALGGEAVDRTQAEFQQVRSQLTQSPRTSSFSPGYFSNVRSRLTAINGFAARINNQRLLQKVQSSPDFESYKFAILGASLGCETIEEFLPTAIQKFHNNTDFVAPLASAQLADMVVKQLQLFAEKTKTAPPQAAERFGARVDSVFGAFLQKMRRPSVSQILGLKFKGKRARRPYNESLVRFAGDLLRIEVDKLLYGMRPEDNFSFYQTRDLTNLNLRYLFEGRGIKIEDWTYDDLIGNYHFSLENVAIFPGSLAQLLVDTEPELKFSETLDLIQMGTDDRAKILEEDFSRPRVKKESLCRAIAAKSVERLSRLKSTWVHELAASKNAAKEQWAHHFSKLDKVPGLAKDLPTNSPSKQSCTQCHFGYEANYTGPDFTRKSDKFPLAFMMCANCHSPHSERIAPQIAFHDQEQFDKALVENPKLRTQIGERLSDSAKRQMKQMPPNYKIPESQAHQIRRYLQL